MTTQKMPGDIRATGLTIRDLKLEIRTGKNTSHKILRGVDVDVPAGKITGLAGESGSGKTMTAMAVCGLLPDGCVTHGEAMFDGQNLLELSQTEDEQAAGQPDRHDISGPDGQPSPNDQYRRPADGPHAPPPEIRETRGQGGAPSNCWRWLRFPARKRPSRNTRINSPAASCNESPSPWRSPATPRCYWPTSQPPHWMSPFRRGC